MTVKELQEELSKYPPNTKVVAPAGEIFFDIRYSSSRYMKKLDKGYKICSKEQGFIDTVILF